MAPRRSFALAAVVDGSPTPFEEAVQLLIPEFAVVTQPRLGAGHLLRLEPNEVIPPSDTPPNEPRSLKYRHVLRHGIQREAVSSGELRHAGFGRGRELLQQSAPCSMAEREEKLVETAI